MLAEKKTLEKDLRRVYGEFKTEQNPQKGGLPQVIVKSSYLDREGDFQEQLRYLEERRELKQDSLVELVFVSKKEHRGLCSNSFSLTCGYEFHLHSLDHEFTRRKQAGSGFSSDELLSVISSVVPVLHTARWFACAAQTWLAAWQHQTRVPAVANLSLMAVCHQAARQPRRPQWQVSELTKVQHLAPQPSLPVTQLLRLRSQRCETTELRIALMVETLHVVPTSSLSA